MTHNSPSHGMCSPPPAILFYCQHLLGVGHLTRSLALCRALCDQFDVVLAQGGPDIGRTVEHPRFRRLQLTPLLMREEKNELYDPRQQRSPDSILAERRAQLDALLQAQDFAAVIVELFPFGRKKFAGEILHLLDAAKARRPRCVTACSLRDILVEKRDGLERDQRIAALVNERFDLVLVHSDPDLIRLEETFSQTATIAERLRYTGFVTEQAGLPSGRVIPKRRPEVLVSLGGGLVGTELALAVLHVARYFPHLLFRFILGPYAAPELSDALRNAASDPGAGKVRAEGFRPDFEHELRQVALSVSLAGYNTVMNILSTRTPALVLPHDANREQGLRAGRLAERGLLRVLGRDDLKPEALRMAIERALQFTPAEVPVDLNGANATARILAAALDVSQKKGSEGSRDAI